MRSTISVSLAVLASLGCNPTLAEGGVELKLPIIQVADGANGGKRPLIQVADGASGSKRPLIQVADGARTPKRPLIDNYSIDAAIV